jgi:hypothetical protein
MAMSRCFGSTSLMTRPADRNRARRHFLEPGQEPQYGRLAAAGRADQSDELAIGNVDGNAVNGPDLAEAFVKIANFY